MPTARVNFDASSLAHGARQIVAGEDVLELTDRGRIAWLSLIPIGWVQRDKVDMSVESGQELPDSVRLFWCVILPGDECPLKENSPPPFLCIITTGIYQVGQGPFFHWSEPSPSVSGGVQADGQVKRAVFVCQAADARDDANGAEGDVSRGDGLPFVIHQNVQGGHAVIVIV